ncbi:MAG: hypothetical protein AAGF86_02850, partial [Pseudomonadota bacterium]
MFNSLRVPWIAGVAVLLGASLNASPGFGEARDPDPIGEFLKQPPAKSINKQDKLVVPGPSSIPRPMKKPEVTPTAAPATQAVPAPGDLTSDAVTIVVTGDTGFSRNHSPVHPDGVLKYGRRQPWQDSMSGIASEIDGDLNFTGVAGSGSGSSNRGIYLSDFGTIESTGTGADAGTITM